MTSPHEDADWLFPDETPSVPPLAPTPFEVDYYEDAYARPQRYATLTAAYIEQKPHTPHARVIRVNDTKLLAYATVKHTDWELTDAGNAQVVAESAAAKRARAA